MRENEESPSLTDRRMELFVQMDSQNEQLLQQIRPLPLLIQGEDSRLRYGPLCPLRFMPPHLLWIFVPPCLPKDRISLCAGDIKKRILTKSWVPSLRTLRVDTGWLFQLTSQSLFALPLASLREPHRPLPCFFLLSPLYTFLGHVSVNHCQPQHPSFSNPRHMAPLSRASRIYSYH